MLRDLPTELLPLTDEQQAMQKLSQSNERENAGTTSLGALLRAKLDKGNE